MKENIERSKWVFKPILRTMAEIYFKSVREFGHEAFNWFETEAQWELHKIEFEFE